MGLIPIFFGLAKRQSVALSFAIQHAMSPDFSGKMGNEVSWHYVPSAYPAVCRIQRDASKKKWVRTYFIYGSKNILYLWMKVMDFVFVPDAVTSAVSGTIGVPPCSWEPFYCVLQQDRRTLTAYTSEELAVSISI